MSECHPEAWVGLGFVATIENAPGQVLTEIEGISSVAAQIAWGLDPVKPEVMEDYLEDLSTWDLEPVGWAWCDARDPAGARNEGLAHARIAAGLPLRKFIANMEEPYDAHSDTADVRFLMPDDYCKAFRSVLPDIEFAVTTTPRWASNHQALRDAGAVHMPQAFFGDYAEATLDACCQFSLDWGWTLDRVRPLVQVYENPAGQVPDPNVYLSESADWEVGVIPYILEQALGGAGRASLTALVPAITRQPLELEEAMKIGQQHGIEATYNRLKKLDPEGCNPAFDPKNWGMLPVEQLKAYDKWCRTMQILVQDHDASA